MRQQTASMQTSRPATSVTEARELANEFAYTREASIQLASPLAPEDCVVQSMPDASPVKWHLAHTTWFFEEMVLARADRDYRRFSEEFSYLFNSYYNSVGAQHHRPSRGMITRPSMADVHEYRRHVDRAVAGLLENAPAAVIREFAPVVEIGLHHEQQHQELILTDVKHLLSLNPLDPIYRSRSVPEDSEAAPLMWFDYPEGVRPIGHDEDGFAYDNEAPRHRVFVSAFQLASRLITNGEYLAFMEDGGYERHELWLSDAWALLQESQWRAPLYWRNRDGRWHQFTLSGLRPVIAAEPVCHVSFYEADAYARWAGCRLPREAEWETAASEWPIEGNFVESGALHPVPLFDQAAGDRLHQLFGDAWEWTASPYVAYPGYRPLAGALGEYNAKFMCNQMVLRGGSCASPRDHLRLTYRNFFPPEARWQFSGIRLARDP